MSKTVRQIRPVDKTTIQAHQIWAFVKLCWPDQQWTAALSSPAGLRITGPGRARVWLAHLGPGGGLGSDIAAQILVDIGLATSEIEAYWQLCRPGINEFKPVAA